ncbi:hypothetical protein ZOSMA_88G00120 [Zostera marina]|uniref:Gamma tubulin complex component C-terminal domain-containing protein n=1 Tax=Zostera marina TaxID=29655 RepID=A0A0K9NKA7_ZOSMR|nr:hypothetical protein ZOSMA_88G00120 [Zostera marina]
MNHFVRNFQDYIMFEVLEISWACFLEEMDASKDLDDLLAAHEKYLSSIALKSLLGERSQGIFKTLFLLGKSKFKKSERLKLGSQVHGGGKALMQIAGDVLRKMEEDLDSISKEYSSSLKVFISQLPLQHHVDLKFLLFRLNFTEYYSRFPPGKY